MALARDAIVEHIPASQTGGPELDQFLARLRFVAVDAEGEEGWAELASAMTPFADRVQVYYLATAPQLFGPICERLGRHGLSGNEARVVIEKPIGKDLASAIQVNGPIGKVFPEERVYRIDHYLGKETVQNLMALRFANALFEPLWNAAHVDHVQITVAEASASRAAAPITTPPAPCATWCRTTCCSCCASSPWSRQIRSTPMPCATRS